MVSLYAENILIFQYLRSEIIAEEVRIEGKSHPLKVGDGQSLMTHNRIKDVITWEKIHSFERWETGHRLIRSVMRDYLNAWD